VIKKKGERRERGREGEKREEVNFRCISIVVSPAFLVTRFYKLRVIRNANHPRIIFYKDILEKILILEPLIKIY